MDFTEDNVLSLSDAKAFKKKKEDKEEGDEDEEEMDVSVMLRDFLFVDPDRDDTFLVDLWCNDEVDKGIDVETAPAPSKSASNAARSVSFECEGVKAELGQTLQSTGLTVWRAAENMNQFIFAQPQRVAGARVVELGAGLGITSILLEKMGCCRRVLATDGCPDTVALFEENMRNNACDGAVLVAKELMWGEGAEEKEDVGAYDVILASDVIYEEEAIVPLLNSMEALLDKTNPAAEVILSFARRNVPAHLFLDAAIKKGFKWALATRDPAACAYVYDANRAAIEGQGWVCIDQPLQPGEPIYRLTWRGLD